MEFKHSNASLANSFPDCPRDSTFCAADAKLPEADVRILTSGGLRIPAHSSVLASASTVLETILGQSRTRRRSARVIPVTGVPCNAVTAFVGFLYSYRCPEEQMEKYGMHLLVLSHVFLVPQLKRRCSTALIRRLTVENVIDVLQLGRLCDAPDLYLKCMQLVSTSFKDVQCTEGWKFLQDHDPWLELQLLQFIDESESRKTMTRKYREEKRLFLELSEAMECLEHICKEGCVHVGPYSAKRGRPCEKFGTCEGVQKLFLHFGTCTSREKGGRCSRCKTMWRLLRLHSSICFDQSGSCRVPLCRQFKFKVQHLEKTSKEDDARWRLLARKVASAKTISSLCPLRPRGRDQRDQGVNGHARGNDHPSISV